MHILDILPLVSALACLPCISLRAKRPKDLRGGLRLLGLRLARLSSEHELRVEFPRGRDIPRSGDLVINERIVVLEVRAGAL